MAKKPKKPAGTNKVCQLKITLLESDPPIWRRFLVPCNIKLSELHYVIQEVMGWEDEHLHEFRKGSVAYTVPGMYDLPGAGKPRNEGKFILQDILASPGTKMTYTYDFGDGWEHELVLEKIMDYEGGQLPVCLEGAMACPPEDCGGIWGYYDMLEVLEEPDHPEYEEMQEWLGKNFDPEAFDVDQINRRLRRLFR